MKVVKLERIRKATVYIVVVMVSLVWIGQVWADTIIYDDDFVDSDWSHSILWSRDNGQASLDFTYQVTSGGNVGAYQTGGHTTDGAGSGIYDGHLFTGGGSYDPSTQGAIGNLAFEADLMIVDGPGYAFGALVRQDGIFYINLLHSWGIGHEWTSFYDPVNDAFWYKFSNGFQVRSSPDFSSAGTPLEFGYYTFNWSSSGGYVHSEWGIDNFGVTIKQEQPIPEPGTMLLFGLGLIGLAGGVRKLKRQTETSLS